MTLVLSAPMRVYLELTHCCNLHCTHCYLGGREQSGELTTSAWLCIIDQLVKMKVFLIVLGGGEPLTRRDIPILAERIVQEGMRVSMTTNGTLISDTLSKALADIGFNGSVQLSLHGSQPATHDRFCGTSGAFERAWSGLNSLLSHGIAECFNDFETTPAGIQCTNLSC
jgi:Fe-coproporphyrin III synthase